MDTINDPDRKSVKTTTITNWLIGKGFLTKKEDGKSQRLPTVVGERIGISVKLRQGQY